MTKFLNLTVVIPTIGEKKLLKTISCLNNGKIAPKKIIIIIYKKNISKIDNKILKFKNVLVIKTKKQGQVYQRYVGFKNAKTKYVMQLDADCLIKISSIIKMISVMTNKKKISVGPCFVNEENFLPMHQFVHKMSLFNKLKNKILGFPSGLSIMGSISKSATNFGVDYKFLKKDIIEVSWIPGGCMMHHRDNLIQKNFYPYNGKAYCEDLIHSNLLKKKQIKLYIVNKSFCKTSFPEFPNKLKDLLYFIRSYVYTAKIYNASIFRILLCVLLYLGRYLKRMLIK